MKVKQTSAIGWALILASIGLTGCHQNPLSKHRIEKSARVLQESSQLAERELKLNRTNGWVYGNCMDGNRAKMDCEAFFKRMLPFVRKAEGYKAVTLADLKDKEAFEPIEEDYEAQRFLSMD
jgi:hypothetical protein